MADIFEDGESFTEEWRLRHETLINEIRSLQSHVTTAPETVEPSQLEVEPQEIEQVQAEIEEIETKIEQVVEELDGDGDGEDMGDSGPSWKRQAKELDRLNARLQASLETSIPNIAMAGPGPKGSCQVKPGRSKSEAPPLERPGRARGRAARSCSPRSQPYQAARPDKKTPPNEQSSKDLNQKMEKMEKMEKVNKKGSEKMAKMDKKGSSTRNDQPPEVPCRSSALATSKWPEPPRAPKRAVVKRRTAPRTVSRRLQVGAPFDQPRMSVMARLSMAQEAKEVEATCAPTAPVTVKNWNIPRLCLEGAQPAPSFGLVPTVPSTTGSYVPSSTSSPQMWYRPVSQVLSPPSGAVRSAAPSQRLAL